MLKTLLINYFGFNRQQRNGLFILLAVIFALFIVRLSLGYFVRPSGIEMKKLELAQQHINSSITSTVKNRTSSTVIASEQFYFDPNTVTPDQLRQLGFTEKKAATFIKFREKGFVFKRKEDLKKIYGLSPALYENIAPFVRIGKILPSAPEKEISNRNLLQGQPPLDINSADSAQLTALPGIGASYAKRIIKYRNLLGGFTSAEQLKEVYGLTPALYDKIKDQVTADPRNIKKLDPNRDDFKTLNRHPYIGYEKTKAIFNKRKQDAITTVNLRDIYQDSSAYNKVLPYLVLDQ